MTTHKSLPDLAPASIYDMPGYLIRRAKQKTTGCFEQITARHGLTTQQYAILKAMLPHPDIDQLELGERIDLDGSTLGDVVTRLEKRGLVLRRVDGRHRRLNLTDEGRTLLLQAQPDVDRAQQQILQPLTAREREQLMRLLSKLVGADNRYHQPTRRRKGGASAASVESV